MAIATDYKISTAEKNAVHVEAQPTILQGSPQENKHAFDAYPDLLTEKHNGLCDFIASGITPTIDTDVLVLYESLGWLPEN
jgi:hypothetical protein